MERHLGWRSYAYLVRWSGESLVAGRGPAPKGNAVRRNKESQIRDVVKYDGAIRGFELPDATEVLPPAFERDADGAWIPVEQTAWHPMTVRMWEAFRSSPMAVAMATEVDWAYLLDTMLMHHSMWTKGSFDMAAEVRQRLAKFGATNEDRLRLRMEVEIPEEYPVGPDGRGLSLWRRSILRGGSV